MTFARSHFGRVTKDDILDFHAQRLSEGENFANAAADIVHILGGIDEVLKFSLSFQQADLSFDDLQNLKALLTTPPENPSLTYTFDADQLWHRISPRLADFVHDKVNLSFAILFGSFAFLVHKLLPDKYSLFRNITDIVVNCGFSIPFCIALILALNPEAFSIVFKSFDFKIKLLLRSFSILFSVSFSVSDFQSI